MGRKEQPLVCRALTRHSCIVEKARVFATAAHSAVSQKRKYTGEDYIVHPQAVVDLLSKFVIGVSDEMLAAAYLHDVVEDTGVPQSVIVHEFGEKIGSYVFGLTNVSKHEDGNRQVRKAMDRFFLSQQSAEVQTIKVADLIDNTSTIVKHDSKFAVIYLQEKTDLLNVMTKASGWLKIFAQGQINKASIKLEEMV